MRPSRYRHPAKPGRAEPGRICAGLPPENGRRRGGMAGLLIEKDFKNKTMMYAHGQPPTGVCEPKLEYYLIENDQR